MSQELPRNIHPEFVGIARLREQHAKTLAMFRESEQARAWEDIHAAHYDWWMFPIDQPSKKGFAYTVYQAEVSELRASPGYLAGYLDGVRILLLSWGWDLQSRTPVRACDPDQRWMQWPIRLEKCGRSLWLFEEFDAYRSVRGYALSLIDEGVDLRYHERDCGDYFRHHHA